MLEIAVVARLINRHQGAQPHRYGRKFPEIRHQPRMRIGRQAAARFQLAAKIFQLLCGETPFQKCARVNSWRGVPLEINRVAFELRSARAEEMIETYFVQRGSRGVS